VYFMWDFVGRTLAMLYGLPPSLPSVPAPPPQGVNPPGGPEAFIAKQKQGWSEGMFSPSVLEDDERRELM
jgi:hypothetical protein